MMSSFSTEAFKAKWHTMSLVDQLANIGSEVERAIHWSEKNDVARFESAFARALELFDATLIDERLASPARRETARVREVFCDALAGTNAYNTPTEFLRKYFLQFGTASQLRRRK